MLSEADPEAKSALYAALGIRLTHDSERKFVRVEAPPSSRGLDRVGGGVWIQDIRDIPAQGCVKT